MFAELLACSSFSFLRGASHPHEVVAQAKELGLDALALCDLDGLYGSARAFIAGRELSQRLIVGAELSLGGPTHFTPSRPAEGRRQAQYSRPAEGGLQARSSAQRKKTEADRPTLALLVENHAGYRNLCRLLTRAHAGRPKGESALELQWLEEHAEGLFAVIPAPCRPGDERTPPPELFEQVRRAFGQRAVLAMHRHRDGFDAVRLDAVKYWSRRYALGIVASSRPLYHHASRKALSDVMYCIRRGTTLDRAGTALGANSEAHLRSEREMLELFRDQPGWVERSAEVAEGLVFSLSELNYQFPCRLPEGRTADDRLRELTLLGLAERYPAGVPAKVLAQVEKELRLIQSIDVAPYFLSTWEIVQMARRRRILCQGRGSAANSAVCYALGITAVDPARSSLLFERFLSVERREPPDIDIDFEHERREEVIQEIYEQYGRDRAAMVSEVICYRGRSALREVGKAFGLSLEMVERLSSSITHWDEAEQSRARLLEMGFDPSDQRLCHVLELAQQLQGFPRHLSIHVGGFVLSATSLDEVAPVEPARMPGRTVVPWDKDDLDALRFFKVDVLGLGMLTAIRKALALIHQDGGLSLGEAEVFDPLDVVVRIPPEDPQVYERLCRADTVGVFQIESRAQMAMLPRLRPRSFYDLVIEVAIVRPGPIQGGMVHPYLRRRNGEEPVAVPHADLSAILERTLGVPLFQEQVMQIAITGAGYSGGEADQLRRDMAAWRRNGKLMRHRERLLEGFAKKGISRRFGEALFEQIKGFGDYGFPESHAASFALLVYASSWQKTHYPAHFACALLNSQPMGFYSPSTILSDARRHGVEVRDVDVTRSNWDCTLEASEAGSGLRAIRLGFRLVKGIGEKSGLRIETARSEWRFSDIEDVARRAELARNEVDALAEAGAFEPLVRGRRQALWQSRAPRLQGLFRDTSWQEPAARLPPLKNEERLLLDYRRKGLSVEQHPMALLRPRIAQRGVQSARELQRVEAGFRVLAAGVVICRQQPATASGVVFMTLEDETGFINLVVFRHVFERFRLAALHSSILLASGKIERAGSSVVFEEERSALPGDEVVHVVVHRLERLDVPGRDIGKVSRDFH
jgi:error-prone DNA polymerase